MGGHRSVHCAVGIRVMAATVSHWPLPSGLSNPFLQEVISAVADGLDGGNFGHHFISFGTRVRRFE